MKKIIYYCGFLLIFNFLSLHSYAADKIHVRALSSFSSINPSQELSVEVIKDGEIDNIKMIKGDVINCTLNKVKNPTRAKQDAKIFLNLESYQDKLGIHNFPQPLRAKYASSVVNKEEIKNCDKKKVAKKTASFVGSQFVPGLSYGISFVDGFAENPEDNRLKSAVKQVYDDSFLSLVEKGSEVKINIADEFYLIVKKAK